MKKLLLCGVLGIGLGNILSDSAIAKARKPKDWEKQAKMQTKMVEQKILARERKEVAKHGKEAGKDENILRDIMVKLKDVEHFSNQGIKEGSTREMDMAMSYLRTCIDKLIALGKNKKINIERPKEEVTKKATTLTAWFVEHIGEIAPGEYEKFREL
jgi:hypothetical protein